VRVMAENYTRIYEQDIRERNMAAKLAIS